ncbi:MAG: serine hydrolase domain-containing protein [Pseudomonadales bacterium]
MTRSVTSLFICLVFFWISNPGLAAPNGSEFVIELENQLLRPLVAETPGAAIVVVVDGRVVLQKTWGVRNVGETAPVTPHTLFRLASLSKTFASAAGSILVRENQVNWDTPISDNIPSIRFNRDDYGQRITLKHLMSQTSGLMPHAYTNLIEDNMTYDRIKQRLDRVHFICAPGECYGYQNVVFSLIGDVVQATARVDYPTYVRDRLFEPLKMYRASFGLSAFVTDDNHAEPHIWTGTRWAPTRTTDHYYRVPPAAGINASIDDMKSWLLAQLGQMPEVLSAEMLDEMHSGLVRTSRQQAHYRWRQELGEVYYGLGWRVFNYGSTDGFVHHGGYVRGMRSEMVFNRDRQLGMVFLTNSEPNQLGELVFDFLDLYQREWLPPAPTYIADSAE